jgi:ISXO2-like transposase domain
MNGKLTARSAKSIGCTKPSITALANTFAASSTPTPSKDYYSIFKRGMKGVYQHCKGKHLHRYLAEFDFRYSYRVRLGYDDVARADTAHRWKETDVSNVSKIKDKKQSERFKEAAREAGADESSDGFDRVLKEMARVKMTYRKEG